MRPFAFVLIILFARTSIYAADCATGISSPQSFYDCAVKSHPDVIGAQLSLEAAKAANDKITQLPNPDLSVTSTNGKNAGENEGGTEVALSLNMTELLVRRSSLNKLGRSEEKLLTVGAQEQEFASRSQVLKSLYRYRQLIDELELVVEALDTFKRIQNQFLSRRARGPEQEITLNLVELAQGDYTLRRNHLNVEKTEIEATFKGIFGSTFEFKKEWLPTLKKNWPAITPASISKQTFELRRREAEQERAEAEKSVANIDSWPQISAGPVYERTTVGSNQFDSYGVNVTVGLPILSFNGGGRSLAEKNLAKSRYAYEYARRKSEMEVQLLVMKYTSAVEALRLSTTNDSLKQKHHRIDALFKQGLASGATVIEAHRQITEFIESQHEHEMVALDSLMYVNLLSSTDVSEVLK